MYPSDSSRTVAPLRESVRSSHFRDLVIVYEGNPQEIPVRLPNISPNGMFINTPHSFPEGAVLKVRFRLTRSNIEVHARAEVRYRLPGVGIGVQFVEISPEAQSAIEEEFRLAEFSLPPKD